MSPRELALDCKDGVAVLIVDIIAIEPRKKRCLNSSRIAQVSFFTDGMIIARFFFTAQTFSVDFSVSLCYTVGSIDETQEVSP